MHGRTAVFDLERPTSIWGLEGRAAWILVRYREIPLGLIKTYPLSGEPAITANRIQAMAVDAFPEMPAAADPGPQPPISVIVCTRNRPVPLGRCLTALGRLDYPEYEVIVVDNAPASDETFRVAGQTSFRYAREDKPGLDNARNRGWREARYPIVAYTDDDTMADPLWLRGFARAFADPGVAGATGLVLPLELEMEAQWIFEEYGGMSKGFSRRIFDGKILTARAKIASHSLGVGANMAFRRASLEAIGGFDPQLDVGTVSGGAGDLDCFHRLLAAGQEMRYEPAALVWHQHRRDIRGLRRQVFNNGRSFAVYLTKIWRTRTVPRSDLVRYALRDWIGGWLLARAWKCLIGNPTTSDWLVWREIEGLVTAPYACWRTFSRPLSHRILP